MACESVFTLIRRVSVMVFTALLFFPTLSQRTPWQDGRFALDRAASRLLTTVN